MIDGGGGRLLVWEGKGEECGWNWCCRSKFPGLEFYEANLVAAKIRGKFNSAAKQQLCRFTNKDIPSRRHHGARFHISRPIIPLPEARSLTVYVDVLKLATSADSRTRGMENISPTIRINFPQYFLDLDDWKYEVMETRYYIKTSTVEHGNSTKDLDPFCILRVYQHRSFR